MANDNPDDPMGNKTPFGSKFTHLPVQIRAHYKKVLVAGAMGFVGYTAYLKMKGTNTFSLFKESQIIPMDSGTVSTPTKANQATNLDQDPKVQSYEKVLDDSNVNTSLQPFINDKKTTDVSNSLKESQGDKQLDAEKMITEMMNARDCINSNNDNDKLAKAEISTVNDEKYSECNDDPQEKIQFPIGRI